MSYKGRRKKQKPDTMRQHFHYLIFQHRNSWKTRKLRQVWKWLTQANRQRMILCTELSRSNQKNNSFNERKPFALHRLVVECIAALDRVHLVPHFSDHVLVSQNWCQQFEQVDATWKYKQLDLCLCKHLVCLNNLYKETYLLWEHFIPVAHIGCTGGVSIPYCWFYFKEYGSDVWTAFS